MKISRPAATALVVSAFLGAAPVAQAAGSNLSTQPPSSIPAGSAGAVTGRHTTQSAQSSGTLPRTGLDLALEAVVAGLLVAGGAAVRAGSATLPE